MAKGVLGVSGIFSSPPLIHLGSLLILSAPWPEQAHDSMALPKRREFKGLKSSLLRMGRKDQTHIAHTLQIAIFI